MLLPSLRTLRSSAQHGLQITYARALAAALHSAASGDGGGGSGSEAPPNAESSQPPAAGGAAVPPATPSQAATQQEEPTQIISIDRSALFNPQPHSHDPAVLAAAAGVDKEPETDLVRHLKALIQVSSAQRIASMLWSGVWQAAANRV